MQLLRQIILNPHPQMVTGTSTQASENYADDNDEKLLAEMHQVWQPTGSQSNGPDPRLAPTVAILVRAVVLLDKTSSRLTKIGFGLTVAGLALTGVSLAPILPKTGPKIRKFFKPRSA